MEGEISSAPTLAQRLDAGLARAASRAFLVVDLATRPIRRDFTTLMSVSCAFGEAGTAWLAEKTKRPQLSPQLNHLLGLDTGVVSPSSHQRRPTKLRTLMVTVPVATVAYLPAKLIGLLSYVAVHFGIGMGGGIPRRSTKHKAAMRAAGTDQLQPDGSEPAATDAIARRRQTQGLPATMPRRQTELGSKIKKVVVFMMENRTYDTFFGRMPGTNGDPNLYTAEDSQKYLFAWWPTHGQWSDRFARWMSVHEQLDPAEIPYHWQNAKQYALLDDYFCFDHGPSGPNHIASAAGWNHNSLANYYTGIPGFFVDLFQGQPEKPPFAIDSTPHHLEAAGLSWGNYGDGSFTDIADLQTSPNNLPSQQFVIDARQGRLRDVSYVAPPSIDNEHAPSGVWVGMAWLQEQVQAIVEGGNWDDTLILVTWDDFGGFADHQVPPEMERWVHNPAMKYALGRRVPLVMMGPYVRTNYINQPDKRAEPGKHRSFLSNSAVIHEVFGLDPTWHDDRPAWTRTDGDTLAGVLDVHQTPAPPPSYTLPQQPNAGFTGRFMAKWRAAGQVDSMADLQQMITAPLGYHESVMRKVMAAQREQVGVSL